MDASTGIVVSVSLFIVAINVYISHVEKEKFSMQALYTPSSLFLTVLATIIATSQIKEKISYL